MKHQRNTHISQLVQLIRFWEGGKGMTQSETWFGVPMSKNFKTRNQLTPLNNNNSKKL